MSRVGIVTDLTKDDPPKNLRSEKSIVIQSTNPKFDKLKFINYFIGNGIWDELGGEVKRKTRRFFRIRSIELVRKPSIFVRLNFEVYKGSPPDYNAIIDTIQEFLPEHGVRVVECESGLIDDMIDPED